MVNFLLIPLFFLWSISIGLGPAFAHGTVPHAPVDPNNLPDSLTSVRGEVVLYDQTGRRFLLNELKGRPVLVNFMYTSCVEVCGLQTFNLRKLHNLIVDIPTEERPLFLSISLDPDTDTSENLQNYARRFSIDTSTWLFASGNKSDISALSAALWIGATDHKDGIIDHRMILHLLDSDLAPVQRYKSNPMNLDHLEREIRSFVTSS